MTGKERKRGSRLWDGAVLAAAGLWGLALVLVFFWVPEIQGLGLDSRIFFFHVPAAWLMLLSAVVAGLASARALASGRPSALAFAATELAALFGLVVMLTGPLWAWRAWGRPWVWEPRLTTSLVCWLSFVAAALLFHAPGGGRKAAQLVAVLGALNVPLVYLSVRWWRGAHHPPGNLVFHMEARLVLGLVTALAASMALWGLLLAARLRQERLADRLARLEARLAALSVILVVGLAPGRAWAQPAGAATSPTGARPAVHVEAGRHGPQTRPGTRARVAGQGAQSQPTRPGPSAQAEERATQGQDRRPGTKAQAGRPGEPSLPSNRGGGEGGSQAATPAPRTGTPGAGPRTSPSQGGRGEPASEAASAASGGFRPYERTGPDRGTVAAVLSAYLALWAVVFLYLLGMGRRTRRLASRIQALEEQVRGTEGKDEPGHGAAEEERRGGGGGQDGRQGEGGG